MAVVFWSSNCCKMWPVFRPQREVSANEGFDKTFFQKIYCLKDNGSCNPFITHNIWENIQRYTAMKYALAGHKLACTGKTWSKLILINPCFSACGLWKESWVIREMNNDYVYMCIYNCIFPWKWLYSWVRPVSCKHYINI